MAYGQKEQVVADLRANFANAPAAFLVRYEGCTCAELTRLRGKLGESGAKFGVVKNTLARKAIADTRTAPLADQFVGMSAVVWSGEDPVAPAKVLSDFAKLKQSFEVRGAIVEGSVVDAKGVEALASLPSREVVLGQLLGTINAPATQLLRTINAPASSLARLLEAWRAEIETK